MKAESQKIKLYKYFLCKFEKVEGNEWWKSYLVKMRGCIWKWWRWRRNTEQFCNRFLPYLKCVSRWSWNVIYITEQRLVNLSIKCREHLKDLHNSTNIKVLQFFFYEMRLFYPVELIKGKKKWLVTVLSI